MPIVKKLKIQIDWDIVDNIDLFVFVTSKKSPFNSLKVDMVVLQYFRTSFCMRESARFGWNGQSIRQRKIYVWFNNLLPTCGGGVRMMRKLLYTSSDRGVIFVLFQIMYVTKRIVTHDILNTCSKCQCQMYVHLFLNSRLAHIYVFFLKHTKLHLLKTYYSIFQNKNQQKVAVRIVFTIWQWPFFKIFEISKIIWEFVVYSLFYWMYNAMWSLNNIKLDVN